ncbi:MULTISPECIES: tautomerase family protein [unclassified Pantoea]|uniref:tautomerase family protein n=1 Tax=unclassified Pantoea TaxID=2630326 RepID=UPI00301E37C6
MPFIEITTREVIPAGQKSTLAQALSDTMLNIEIGGPTDAACTRDWIWFHVLSADDWAIGGRFDETYRRGRMMCLARIIAPEGFMNTELKLRAIAEVTADIRKELKTDPSDDGTGIWVHLTEIPEGQWGAAGLPTPLFSLIDGMGGTVSDQRRNEMEEHFTGINKLRDHFGIPK